MLPDFQKSELDIQAKQRIDDLEAAAATSAVLLASCLGKEKHTDILITAVEHLIDELSKIEHSPNDFVTHAIDQVKRTLKDIEDDR